MLNIIIIMMTEEVVVEHEEGRDHQVDHQGVEARGVELQVVGGVEDLPTIGSRHGQGCNFASYRHSTIVYDSVVGM